MHPGAGNWDVTPTVVGSVLKHVAEKGMAEKFEMEFRTEEEEAAAESENDEDSSTDSADTDAAAALAPATESLTLDFAVPSDPSDILSSLLPPPPPTFQARPGIVHRLDRDTSGLLFVALSRRTHSRLTHLFSSRGIYKSYLAVVASSPPAGPNGGPLVIKNNISRHPTNRQKYRVTPAVHSFDSPSAGKSAESHVEVLLHDPSLNLSLVSVRILTGRTHQIRVHLSHLNCGILGDEVYGVASGGGKTKSGRMMLHAREMRVEDPAGDGKDVSEVVFKASVPEDFAVVVRKMKGGEELLKEL